MFRAHLLPRLLLVSSFACLTLLHTDITHADQVILVEGREVRLNADGSWQYISNDRIADTPDGKRARLMDDGKWEYIGNSPVKTEQVQRTTSLALELQNVVIERTEKKVQKNTRVRTRTVFTINLQQAKESGTSLALD